MSAGDLNPFPHLELKERKPEDRAAALSAFERLYRFSRQSGRTALAIFATYKAIQKLEEPAAGDGDEGIVPVVPDVQLPPWMREGLWFALETYILKPDKQKGITTKGRVIGFSKALYDDWDRLKLWTRVEIYMAENKVKADRATSALAGPDASKSTLDRAHADIKEFFENANHQGYLDDQGHNLAPVESRDMVPTQQLLSIFGPPKPVATTI